MRPTFSSQMVTSTYPLPRLIPVEGEPAWVKSDHYDLNVKVEGTPDGGVMRGAMLRALLEDRFKLKIHRETREVPVYDLTVARSGSKLKPTKDGSCVDLFTIPPPKPPAPGQSMPAFCGSDRGKRSRLNQTMDFLGLNLD